MLRSSASYRCYIFGYDECLLLGDACSLYCATAAFMDQARAAPGCRPDINLFGWPESSQTRFRLRSGLLLRYRPSPLLPKDKLG